MTLGIELFEDAGHDDSLRLLRSCQVITVRSTRAAHHGKKSSKPKLDCTIYPSGLHATSGTTVLNCQQHRSKQRDSGYCPAHTASSPERLRWIRSATSIT